MMDNLKILIVDDSKEWLSLHEKFLKSSLPTGSFEKETASTGNEAYNMVIANKEKPYDLIITDLEMELTFDEENAGIWLIKNLIERDELKDTKFLIISGCHNVKEIAEDLKVSYIAKDNLLSNPAVLKYKLSELL